MLRWPYLCHNSATVTHRQVCITSIQGAWAWRGQAHLLQAQRHAGGSNAAAPSRLGRRFRQIHARRCVHCRLRGCSGSPSSQTQFALVPIAACMLQPADRNTLLLALDPWVANIAHVSMHPFPWQRYLCHVTSLCSICTPAPASTQTCAHPRQDTHIQLVA